MIVQVSYMYFSYMYLENYWMYIIILSVWILFDKNICYNTDIPLQCSWKVPVLSVLLIKISNVCQKSKSCQSKCPILKFKMFYTE